MRNSPSKELNIASNSEQQENNNNSSIPYTRTACQVPILMTVALQLITNVAKIPSIPKTQKIPQLNIKSNDQAKEEQNLQLNVESDD